MRKILLVLFVLASFCLFADVEVEPNDTWDASGVFTVVNGQHTGTVDPGEDLDYFAFAASIGDVVVVSTVGLTEVDTKLWIYGIDGITELAYNDDTGGLQSTVTITVELSGTYYFVVGSYSTNTGDYGVDLSGANTPTYLDNDLMAMGITGNPTPTDGIVSTCSVSMMNIGNNDATNFTVELFNGADVSIGSTDVASLVAGENTTVDVDWTPSVVGAGVVYAVIDFAADEDTDNNQTADFMVDVQASGTVVVSIGDGVETTNTLPINYFWKNSLTEQLYYASEFQVGGALMAIDFFYNFTEAPLVSDFKVWIGETSLTDLTGGYIPSTELTLVHDGPYDFVVGEGALHIVLDTPYAYGGGNLVVLVQRPLDTEYYDSSDVFYYSVDAVNVGRSVEKHSDTDEFDPTQAYTDGGVSGNYANAAFYFVTEGMGAITGTVTSAGNPVADAMVAIDGTAAATTTNAAGEYSFPYVMEGDVTLTASKFGFYDGTATATVVEDETTTSDITMLPLPTVMVSGDVFGSDYPTVGLVDATVSLSGYENYEGMTDANGHFEITGVYANQTYDIGVSVAGYQAYTGTVDVVDADVVVDDITLLEVVSPASNVVATPNAEYTSVEVTWEEPTGAIETEFRYDDGVVLAQLGFGANPSSVLGGAHFYNATITEVTWLLTSNAAHTEAVIYLFGLDATGMPDDSQLLHESAVQPNVDDAWNTYTLPTPVEAPNGFFVGVCTPNVFTAIGMDDGVDEPYVFQEGTQWGIADWTAGTNSWLDVGPEGFPQNFTIRALGANNGAIDISRTANSFTDHKISGLNGSMLARSIDAGTPVYNTTSTTSRMVETYDVYRLLAADQGTPELWTSLAEDLTDMSYTDAAFAGLTGVYKYAVVAMFTNDVAAPAAFSNEIESGVAGSVTFVVTSNDGNAAEGALITFTATDGDPEHDYEATTDAAGNAIIDNVWFTTYDLDVTLSGHNPYAETGIVFDVDTTINVVLNEVTVPPAGLEVTEFGDDSATITWTAPGTGAGPNLVEGFETWPPVGWIFTDADGDGYQWDDGGALGLDAHTGVGVAYSASYDNTAGALTPDNWFITPQVELGYNASVNYWVAAQDDAWAGEHYGVYVSTTGTDVNDFELVFEETMVGRSAVSQKGPKGSRVQGTWYEKTVDLSSYSGNAYVAFRHFNVTDMYFLDLDDVTVFTSDANREVLGYNVYLDGTEVASDISETVYAFTGLELGTVYEAGVTAVYTGDIESEMVTVEITTTDDGGDLAPALSTKLGVNYPNPFNPVTNIRFSLKNSENVSVQVYNVRGELVNTLVNERLDAGDHHVVWEGYDNNLRPCASGVYFYKMKAGRYTSTKKMILMK